MTIPKYFVVTSDLKNSNHDTLSEAILKCKQLFSENKKFTLLNSMDMKLLGPGDKIEDALLMWTQSSVLPEKQFLILRRSVNDVSYTIHYFLDHCDENNMEEFMQQYCDGLDTWVGYFLGRDFKHFASFTEKFGTFQDLLLAKSKVLEGLFTILNGDKPIEHALLLAEDSQWLQYETQRLILNPNYNDLRKQLYEEQLKKQQPNRTATTSYYENATLEDLASDFGSFEIDPDSLYDK